MSKLRDIQARVLVDGEDLHLCDADLAEIQAYLSEKKGLDTDDLRVLIDMRSQARVVSPGFDRLFFPAFKSWLLDDGRISLAEQFQLLRVLYGGGKIDQTEREFLKELRRDTKEVTPEFEALYQQAMRDCSVPV